MNVTVVLPPHTDGAPILSLVKTPAQPPDAVADANHDANAASISACVENIGMVTGAGQLSTGVVAGCTANVRVQSIVVPQLFVAVKVTVTEPPQALGAPVLLLLNTVLQPPLTVADANQALNFMSISACV